MNKILNKIFVDFSLKKLEYIDSFQADIELIHEENTNIYNYRVDIVKFKKCWGLKIGSLIIVMHEIDFSKKNQKKNIDCKIMYIKNRVFNDGICYYRDLDNAIIIDFVLRNQIFMTLRREK